MRGIDFVKEILKKMSALNNLGKRNLFNSGRG